MESRKLLSWNRRKENLKNIKRYNKFDVMFYRTNDLIHSQRVLGLLEEFLPYIKKLYPNFDEKMARLIAIHHDDHEIIISGGDISLQLKLMMNDQELSSLKQKETLAVEKLSESFPKTIEGYGYKQLMLNAIKKDCIEAQAVSFVDKIDGYCEAIHEVLAGNSIFLEPVINYNLKTFNNLGKKYPLIKKVFKVKNNWFDLSIVVDLKEFFENGNVGSTPHTKVTIERKTLIPQYEVWKKVTLKITGISPLINQIEFHRK